MNGLELDIAEVLYTAVKRTRPTLVRTIEELVGKNQRKARIMEFIHRGSLRSAGNGWAVGDLEQVVDYIIHRKKEGVAA